MNCTFTFIDFSLPVYGVQLIDMLQSILVSSDHYVYIHYILGVQFVKTESSGDFVMFLSLFVCL